ncbi:MAG TPA: hypothetical protein VN743_11615, partial [Blastocatellia bacterium]|nr:hypothetical protein [Blastocatellia bacterium]
DVTLTIELPDNLRAQLNERQIPEEEIKAVAIAALEVWLAQQHSTNGGRFTESAVPFVRRLIAENRDLFDALAKR